MIFIYMIVVKPKGALIVTYEYKKRSEEKTCQSEQKRIKAAAGLCSFCNYDFNNG
jgi:hypothetical protein